MGLLDDIPDKERRLIAAGQAYFVSDGNHYSSSSTFVKVVRKQDAYFYANGKTIYL